MNLRPYEVAELRTRRRWARAQLLGWLRLCALGLAALALFALSRVTL